MPVVVHLTETGAPVCVLRREKRREREKREEKKGNYVIIVIYMNVYAQVW
jgi:hypothetical protein